MSTLYRVILQKKVGNGGIILVLFETPSGFVIFSYDGVILSSSQMQSRYIFVFTNAFVLITWLLVCCSRLWHRPNHTLAGYLGRLH